MKTFFLCVLLLSSCYCFSQCPPEGSAKNPKEQALNVEKNKPILATRMLPKKIALNRIIKKVNKPDHDKFTEGDYVSVTGYIVDFKEEGGESCNCGKAEKSKKTGDVHINFGLVPDAAKKNCMIVEITPSFKKSHPDYETLLQKGGKVTITGYLLYDFLHEASSLSTCTSCANAWRKTCWEIHPIASITPQ